MGRIFETSQKRATLTRSPHGNSISYPFQVLQVLGDARHVDEFFESRIKRAVSCGGKCAPQGRPSGVLIRSAGQQRARSLASRRRGRGRESRNAMYVQPLKHTFRSAWWSKSNCNCQHPCRWTSSQLTQLGEERCREPTPNLLANLCSVKRAHSFDNSNDKCPHRLERLAERRRQTVRLLAGEPTSGCWSPVIGLDPNSDGGRSDHARRGLCVLSKIVPAVGDVRYRHFVHFRWPVFVIQALRPAHFRHRKLSRYRTRCK